MLHHNPNGKSSVKRGAIVAARTPARLGILGENRVERAVSDDHEVVEAPLPNLITASSELGELRPSTVQDLIAS